MFPGRSLALACVCTLLVLTGTPASEQNEQRLPIDTALTSITIRVGKTGLFSLVGHDHEVVAPVLKGSVTVDRSDVRRSSVSLEFDAGALKVTGKDEPVGVVPEAQRVMLSDRVLDVGRYPNISFHSSGVSLVEGSRDQMLVRVTGDLTLHGMTRPLTVPVKVRLAADRLVAEGKVIVRQSDFGIQPVTVAGGTVKVKDQLDIAFKVMAIGIGAR